MVLTLDLVLLVLSFLCFACATVGIPDPARGINLQAAGLGLWILSIIV